MTLALRKVKHPQATDNYRVVYEGIEIGSIGVHLLPGPRIAWRWGIDTVLPRQPFATDGEGVDREDCMAQFKATWEVFRSDPERLAAFLDLKARARG